MRMILAVMLPSAFLGRSFAEARFAFCVEAAGPALTRFIDTGSLTRSAQSVLLITSGSGLRECDL